MTEKQKLKWDLLQEYYKMDDAVEFCREAYKFITEDDEPKAVIPQVTTQAGKLADGIYLIDVKGNAVRFTGQQTETIHDTAYVGVVMGDHSVAVALNDCADGEDITLTSAKDPGDGTYYDTCINAVADWNGKANTEHLKAIGLNKAIELKDGEYIAALGEWYLIFMHRKAINEALEFVGGKPIGDAYYWSSTEYSSPGAWYLNLGNGYMNSNPKAPVSNRVRPVSAFIM